jgi:hypothetical protein
LVVVVGSDERTWEMGLQSSSTGALFLIPEKDSVIKKLKEKLPIRVSVEEFS